MTGIIEVKTQITVDVIDDKFFLNGTDLSLGMTPNLGLSQYFDENDYPNQQGCEAISKTLVAGLSGNIHMAHKCGYIDSAKHLRSIISQLEAMFVLNPTLDYVDEKEVQNG